MEKEFLIEDFESAALDYLNNLNNKMGLNCAFSSSIEKNTLTINIEGEDVDLFLPPKFASDRLNALQYLTLLSIDKNLVKEFKLIIDAKGYREKRKQELQRLARKVARKVKETGKKESLKPMNPYERLIIHTVLAGDNMITAESEGQEPRRYVVIKPTNEITDLYNNQEKNYFKKNGFGKRKSFGQKRSR